ncbi:MAG TPA: helix-turn-helix transcriptional regulator [Planctomycetota bacterium]|nr:helix-turn-helix transcriptional regulator [Planctomycetota bacterium]
MIQKQLSEWRGSALLKAREAAGMSRAQVAAAIDVSEDTIRAWEDGRGKPRRPMAEALARFLKVAVEEIAA